MRRFRFVLFPIVLLPLVALAMMGLWNWLMPAVFGLTAINFLQALGLLLLAKLLFGRFGGRGRMMFAPSGMGHGCGPHGMSREKWKQQMQERWQNLNPEQKERFTEHRKRCFGKEVSPENTGEPRN